MAEGKLADPIGLPLDRVDGHAEGDRKSHLCL